MCCRYYIDDTADEMLPYLEMAAQSSLTEKMVAKLGKALKIKGEIRPTDMVPGIARSTRGNISSFPMIWGFTSPGAKSPIFNARSETAGEKPMFRAGWSDHRCVLPASYFFEWGIMSDAENRGMARQKDKYAIQPKGETVTWLAGIYRMIFTTQSLPFSQKTL